MLNEQKKQQIFVKTVEDQLEESPDNVTTSCMEKSPFDLSRKIFDEMPSKDGEQNKIVYQKQKNLKPFTDVSNNPTSENSALFKVPNL